MQVYTTLKKLREAGACKNRYKHLRKSLGKNYGNTTPIDVVTILKTNGLDDVLWIPEDALIGNNIQTRYRLFAVACCQDILHLMEDKRSVEAVKTAHLYAHGEATKNELYAARYAAGDAFDNVDTANAVAWNACRAACRVVVVEGVAWYSAWNPAIDAEWYSARNTTTDEDAAWAARYAAKEKQSNHFRIIFSADFGD